MMRAMTEAWLETAIRAARAAAAIQQFHSTDADLEIATKSSQTDLVTLVDRLCEERIREIIQGDYPDHAVLGEEQGAGGGSDAGHRWIVDPLDGTLNYAHGFPYYCVSIALEVNGIVEVGVVLDGTRNELYTAVRGGGARLNGAPIQTTTETEPGRALLGTGFSYDQEMIRRNIEIFARVMPHVRAIRRPGAGALDLCQIAAGRFDGFWELTLNPWDVAAGTLIVREAGGVVSDRRGREYDLNDPVLVASNGPLHPALIDLLAIPD